MGRQLKIASLYSGRSMSQPVLLNELNNLIDIDLHLFRTSKKNDVEIKFSHRKYVNNVETMVIKDQKPLWINQYLSRRQWTTYLEEHFDSDFDLVIGMNDLGPPAVSVANKYGIPSLFFIRNLSCSGQEKYSPVKSHLRNIQSVDLGGKVQYPFLVENFKTYRRELHEATEAIANSEYVATRLNRDFGIDPETIYPPITLEEYRVEYNRNGRIGMVGPRNEEKGADIFLNIVKMMPSKKFISAGIFRDQSLEERAESLDNLHHMGYVEDMREFYARTKIVLVPSRFPEAFGRAAAEPMVSGIPCVVSDRGGLPEVVGDTGEIVTQIESTDEWIKSIQKALDSHDPKAQIDRSKNFSTERQGKKLYDSLKLVVN